MENYLLINKTTVKIPLNNCDIFISGYKNGTIHIQKVKEKLPEKSKVVLLESDCEIVSDFENENSITINFKKSTVVFNKTTKTLNFYNGDKLLLKEQSFEMNEIYLLDEKFYKFNQNYTLTTEEAIYGLGQFHDGVVNYRNHNLKLAQGYLESVNPFLLSTNGYAILWDNYSQSFFSDDKDKMSFSSDVGNCLDYYILVGNNADEIIANYRDLTGKAPMFPRWVFGYQQCKCTYESFKEMQDIVSEYRKREVPLDCVVQDWFYWGTSEYYSSLHFGQKGYENPVEEIKKIHDQNAKLLVSIWPVLGNKTDVYKKLNDENLMLPYDGSRVLHTRVYDASSSRANDIYYDFLKRGLLDTGVDSLWMDGVEPEYGQRRYTEDYIKNVKCSAGPIQKVLNTFSLDMTDGIYSRYRKDNPQKRMYILTRSSFSGQQRNGAVTWSGDVAGEWDCLKTQISNAINFTYSGLPYWSHDIGGWSYDTYLFPEFNLDKSFAELYTRWFAFGAFTSIFRSHGVKAPREIWQFGKKGDIFYDALVTLIKLRYSLISYIYSTSYDVYANGYSMMRGLAMDFSNDPKVLNINNEYMFGKNLLIHPVTDDMYHVNPLYRTLTSDELTIESNNFDENQLTEIFETSDFQSQVVIDSSLFDDVTNHFKLTGTITPKESGDYYLLVDNAVFAQLYLDGELTVNSQPNPYHVGTHFIKFNLKANHCYKMIMDYTPMNKDGAVIKWKTPSMYNEQMTIKEPTATDIYLPCGANWYDYYTNEHFTGGKTISKVIPIDQTGLFVKEGSIMLKDEVLQYTTEKLPNIEVVIYSGTNGSFTLYEDENDNYNYENGKFSLIEFNWNDKNKILTLSDRAGEFDTMTINRTFNVTLVTNKNIIKNATTINYNGKATSVKL